MRFDCCVFSVKPLVDTIPDIVNIMSPLFQMEEAKAQLFSEMDEPERRDLHALVELGKRSDEDELELTAPKCGRVAFAWSRGKKPGFQLVSLDMLVGDARVLVDCLRQLITRVDARYAYADWERAYQASDWEMRSRGREIPPIGCLRDLYWYNFFGSELTEMLTTAHALDFQVPGLETSVFNSGLEVRVCGEPTRRPHQSHIEDYIKQSGVFLRVSPKARFARRVAYDFSRLA